MKQKNMQDILSWAYQYAYDRAGKSDEIYWPKRAKNDELIADLKSAIDISDQNYRKALEIFDEIKAFNDY